MTGQIQRRFFAGAGADDASGASSVPVSGAAACAVGVPVRFFRMSFRTNRRSRIRIASRMTASASQAHQTGRTVTAATSDSVPETAKVRASPKLSQSACSQLPFCRV